MFTIYFPKVRFLGLEFDAVPTTHKPKDDNYTIGKAQIIDPTWRQDKEDGDILLPINGQFNNPDNPHRVNCYNLNQAIEHGIVKIMQED